MFEKKEPMVIQAVKEIVQLNDENLNFVMGYIQGLAHGKAQQKKKGA